MAVRAAVARGDVADAIARVNDLDPDVLERRPALLFALQRQRLIELIRGGDVEGALDFASEFLAPHAEAEPAFREELEKALALLVFASPSDAPPALAELLAPAQRAAAADELNAAVLHSQGHESGARQWMRGGCVGMSAPRALTRACARRGAQRRGCRGC